MKWGKAGNPFKQLNRKVQEAKVRGSQEFCEQMANELANRLLRAVKQRTPVGVPPDWIGEDTYAQYWSGYNGGELRKAWKITDTQIQGKRTFVIEVYNPMKYAPYVEYGHRQNVGAFIPAIERPLVKPWVEGQHMLQISAEEIRSKAPAIIQKRLHEELERMFGDD